YTEAAVQLWVIDQPLPAHRRARLLKVHTHHDLQRITQLFAQGHKAFGIFQRRFRVMDRTGADHHREAVIIAGDDPVERFATGTHSGGCSTTDGTVAHDFGGRAERGD